MTDLTLKMIAAKEEKTMLAISEKSGLARYTVSKVFNCGGDYTRFKIETLSKIAKAFDAVTLIIRLRMYNSDHYHDCDSSLLQDWEIGRLLTISSVLDARLEVRFVVDE